MADRKTGGWKLGFHFPIYPLVLLILFIFFLLPKSYSFGIVTPTINSKLPIAEAMRKLQIRYYALTQNYIQWPPCKLGTPAPPYPSDTFYAEDMKDPEKVVELVQCIVDGFGYGTALSPLYSCFIKDGDITQYSVDTFGQLYITLDDLAAKPFVINVWLAVNLSNYEQVFWLVKNDIELLKRFPVSGYEGDLSGWHEGGSGFGTECVQARNQAISNYWNSDPRIGSSDGLSMELSTTCFGGNSYFATASYFTQSRITCDLTQWEGSCAIYLQVTDRGYGAQHGSPVAPSGHYEYYTNADLPQNWESSCLLPSIEGYNWSPDSRLDVRA